jgi:hypothetical protein
MRRLTLLFFCLCLAPLARSGEMTAGQKKQLIAKLKTQIAYLTSEIKRLERKRAEYQAALAKLQGSAVSPNEAKAAAALRAYASAQNMFKRNDWDADGTLEYAVPYSLLHSSMDLNKKPIKLISAKFSNAMGAAGTAYNGYLFKDLTKIGGTKISWVTDYGLCATPAKYGPGSKLTFIISTSGTVYFKDLGKAKFVDDYPANPAGAGWKIAR